MACNRCRIRFSVESTLYIYNIWLSYLPLSGSAAFGTSINNIYVLSAGVFENYDDLYSIVRLYIIYNLS